MRDLKRIYVIIVLLIVKIFVVNICKYFNLLSFFCYKDWGNWKCVVKWLLFGGINLKNFFCSKFVNIELKEGEWRVGGNDIEFDEYI